jgi:hypothetical protein
MSPDLVNRLGLMRRPRLGELLTVAVFVAIFGTVIGVVAWHSYTEERAILNGPRVVATVTGYGSCKETRAYQCCRGGRYCAREIGVTVVFVGSDERTIHTAVAYLPRRAPKVGSKIAIRYNPDDPAEAISVAEHEGDWRHARSIFVIFAVGIPLVVVAAYVGHRRRARRASRVPSIGASGDDPRTTADD